MSVRKVLVVDDESDIRRIATISLKQVGQLDVVTAESGAEALVVARANPPDVILLDFMMPGLDGVATLMGFKRTPELAHIPIILLTARTQQREVERFIRLGAAGVVAKPFDPMRLPDEVLRIVEAVS